MNQKNVAFAELFNASTHVFDAITSSIPYPITENNSFSYIIYLLLTNNNHFDLLLIRGVSKKIDFKRFNKGGQKLKNAILKRNES